MRVGQSVGRSVGQASIYVSHHVSNVYLEIPTFYIQNRRLIFFRATKYLTPAILETDVRSGSVCMNVSV